MNTRKKVFFSLLVVAFLFIFSKCVYAETGKYTYHFNVDNLTLTDADSFEVYAVLDDLNTQFVGYNFNLDYDRSAIRIDSVTQVTGYWKMDLYTESTGMVFGELDETKPKDSRLVKINGTILDETGNLTIGFVDCGLADENYDDVDPSQIASRGITITKAAADPIDINVPTGTGYQEGNQDPTPSTITEEPTEQTPTQQVTQIADNGSTGDVNVVDNAATPTPKATTDNTKANKKIPQTGANLSIYAIIGSALFGTVLLYKKYSNK